MATPMPRWHGDWPDTCPLCTRDINKSIQKDFNRKRNCCQACAKKQIRAEQSQQRRERRQRIMSALTHTPVWHPSPPQAETPVWHPSPPQAQTPVWHPNPPHALPTLDDIDAGVMFDWMLLPPDQLPILQDCASPAGSSGAFSSSTSSGASSSAASDLLLNDGADWLLPDAGVQDLVDFENAKMALEGLGLVMADEARFRDAAQPRDPLTVLKVAIKFISDPSYFDTLVGLLGSRGSSDGRVRSDVSPTGTGVRIRCDDEVPMDVDEDEDEDDYENLFDTADPEEMEQILAEQRADRLSVVEAVANRLKAWFETPEMPWTSVFTSETACLRNNTRIHSFDIESCEANGSLNVTLRCTGSHQGANTFKAHFSIVSAFKTFRINELKFEATSQTVISFQQEKPLQVEFVSETLEDGTKVRPNAAVVKTWTLRNTDTRPWKDVEVVDSATNAVVFKLPTVQPQQETVVEVTVQIPPLSPGSSQDTLEQVYRLRKDGKYLPLVLSLEFEVH